MSPARVRIKRRRWSLPFSRMSRSRRSLHAPMERKLGLGASTAPCYPSHLRKLLDFLSSFRGGENSDVSGKSIGVIPIR